MPSIRAIAAGTSAIENPNLESAWPVEIFSCVSPRTLGVTLIRTCWGWEDFGACAEVGDAACGISRDGTCAVPGAVTCDRVGGAACGSS